MKSFNCCSCFAHLPSAMHPQLRGKPTARKKGVLSTRAQASSERCPKMPTTLVCRNLSSFFLHDRWAWTIKIKPIIVIIIIIIIIINAWSVYIYIYIYVYICNYMYIYIYIYLFNHHLVFWGRWFCSSSTVVRPAFAGNFLRLWPQNGEIMGIWSDFGL